MKLLLIIVTLAALSPLSHANELFNGQWIDLTHEFSEDSIYWPTEEPFKKITVFRGRTEAGFYYAAYKFCTAEHGGTHIDAPIHFFGERNTVEKILQISTTKQVIYICLSHHSHTV